MQRKSLKARQAASSLAGSRSNSRHSVGRASRAVVESLESRTLLSGTDPAVAAYQARVANLLQTNITTIQNWAAQHTSETDNINTGGLSEWTAAAAFSQSGVDQATVNDGYKLAGSLMEYRVANLFSGGNDGWEAWATADTYDRFRSVIQADTLRYQPANYAANPSSGDGKYSLDDLFKIVLTQSQYLPVDTTSNHTLMNATARYLAEQAFPGQVVHAYNNNSSDPTGASTVSGRAVGLESTGPDEYGGPNYGPYNWAEFLSVSELTTLPQDAGVAQQSAVAYETALNQVAAFWMNGNLAMSTGRGYPSTGAFQPAEGYVLPWVYFGGDFGSPGGIQSAVSTPDVKTLGVLGVLGYQRGYTPPAGVMHLTSDGTPHVSQANFGTNHEYAYVTGGYAHYSESSKSGGTPVPQIAAYRSRVVWTKPADQAYQATAWVIDPATTWNGSSWTYVDPTTLQAYPTSGSQTYGEQIYEEVTQSGNTALHVLNVPPETVSPPSTGAQYAARGALIYLPTPVVGSGGEYVAADGEWVPPQISSDGYHLFVAYNSVFMAFVASSPISAGTVFNDPTNSQQAQFFNVYGGTTPGQTVAPSKNVQIGVALETASPNSYPGTTLAEQFANFKTAMLLRRPPVLENPDLSHPVWRYSDATSTITAEFSGDSHYGSGTNLGRGQDFIAGPNDTNPQVVDYATWPLTRATPAAGGSPWLNVAQRGDMTLNYPGSPGVFYDYQHSTSTAGTDAALSAAPAAPGSVQLDWQAGFGETAWTVERSTDDANWTTLTATLPAGTTTYSDTGLTQGQWYYYRVTPTGTASPVGPSAPAGAAVAFAAPSNLQVRATSTTAVSLTWSNNATGAANVRLQYADDGYEEWFTAGTYSAATTSATLSGLAPGSRRYYRVVAVNSSASSVPSNVAGTELSTPYLNVTLSMPEYLAAATLSASQVQLTWKDTAVNETAYQVERSLDGTTWTVLTASLPAGSSSYTDGTVVAGTLYDYRVAAKSGATLSAYSDVATVTAGAPNQPPTIVQAASATPGVVTGTSTQLSVLGGDDGGEANLTYSWTVSAGPGSVAFSDDGTNAAKGVTATFDRAGTYLFNVVVTDALGDTAAGTVSVTVYQTPTSVAVTPPSTRVPTGSSLQLGASVVDQFGLPMQTQPPVRWATTAGSITPAGVFTAPATTGMAVVSAAAGTTFGTTNLSYVVMPSPTAYYAFEDGGGSVAADSSGNGFNASLGGGVRFDGGLTVGGVSTGGLDFSGSGTATLGNPSALNFSGAITLSAWIKPSSTTGIQTILEHGYATSPNAEVNLRIANGTYWVGSWNGTSYAATAAIPGGDVNQWVFLAGVYDPAQSKWLLYRDGVLVGSGTATVGALAMNKNWTIGSTDVSTDRRYYTGSVDEVRISNVAYSATDVANLYDYYTSPTVASAAAVTGSTATTASLSVLGAAAAGEGTLKYAWYAVGNVPAPVSFSAGGTNAAKNTVATFGAPGVYHLAAVISDGYGHAASSLVTVTVEPLLANSADVGSVGSAGSSSVSGGAYTVKGSGADIWNTADAFHYTWTTLAGDGQIVARVTSVQNTNAWAKAAVMFRDSAAANAPFVDQLISAGSGASFQDRSAAGGSCNFVQTGGFTAPYWVKLVRSGSTFTGYIAPDGVTWTKVGSANVTMAGTALVGLAVTSHNNSALCTATFDNVSVTPYSDLALNKPASATSAASGSSSANAVDGNAATAWTSTAAGAQTLSVDLGTAYSLSHLTLTWGSTYATAFSVQVSSDNSTWATLYSSTTGAGGVLDLPALAVTGRYVKVAMTGGTLASYAISGLSVYGA